MVPRTRVLEGRTFCSLSAVTWTCTQPAPGLPSWLFLVGSFASLAGEEARRVALGLDDPGVSIYYAETRFRKAHLRRNDNIIIFFPPLGPCTPLSNQLHSRVGPLPPDVSSAPPHNGPPESSQLWMGSGGTPANPLQTLLQQSGLEAALKMKAPVFPVVPTFSASERKESLKRLCLNSFTCVLKYLPCMCPHNFHWL